MILRKLKNFSEDILARIIFRTPKLQGYLGNSRNNNRVLILVYHRVCNQKRTILSSVPCAEFEKQIKYLSRIYNFVNLENITQWIQGKAKMPSNPVAITFDDGYRDIYANAYPILRKFGIPATVFITTDFIDNHKIPWWERTYYLIQKTDPEIKGIPEISKHFRITGLKDRELMASEVVRKLRYLPQSRREKLISSMAKESDVRSEVLNQRLMLSWDEIREMANNGVSFGSHTITHPVLTQISKNQAKNEIKGSKEIIEEKLDRKVNFFSYPHGSPRDFNLHTTNLVREAAYEGACTTIQGFNTRQANPYKLKRVSIWGDLPLHRFTYEISNLSISLRSIKERLSTFNWRRLKGNL